MRQIRPAQISSGAALLLLPPGTKICLHDSYQTVIGWFIGVREWRSVLGFSVNDLRFAYLTRRKKCWFVCERFSGDCGITPYSENNWHQSHWAEVVTGPSLNIVVAKIIYDLYLARIKHQLVTYGIEIPKILGLDK